MVTLGTTIDVAAVLCWVGRIAGDTDPRHDRVAAVLTGAMGVAHIARAQYLYLCGKSKE